MLLDSYLILKAPIPQTSEAMGQGSQSGNNTDERKPFSLPEIIPEGDRDNTLHRYACSLYVKGCSDDEVWYLITKANEGRCENPINEEQLTNLYRSAKRQWGNSDERRAKLNRIETIMAFSEAAKEQGQESEELTDVLCLEDLEEVMPEWLIPGYIPKKEITVMASGMGMASIGIYANELYDYYDVENIIRIGTCGVFDESVGLLDVLLVDGAYNYDDDDIHWAEATKEINDIASNVANELNIKCIRSNIASTECFDPYQPHHAIGYLSRLPKDKNIVGTEMEAFALYYLAKKLNKKASCLLSVVDTNYPGKDNSKIVTVEQRQNALNDMIKIGLETAIRL